MLGLEVCGLNLENIANLVITCDYWPINYEIEHFQYPEQFKQLFTAYESFYEERKHSRRLITHNNIGSVELELEFSGE